MSRLALLLLWSAPALGAPNPVGPDLAEPWVTCETPDPYDAIAVLPDAERQALVERLVAEGLVAPRAPSPVELGLAADARAAALTVESRLERARAALVAGDAAAAVGLLRPVADDPRVAPFWQEAVDAHVYAERERAGRIVSAARGFGREVRRAELRAARQILVELVDGFPESVFAEPVLDALARVDRALDDLER